MLLLIHICWLIECYQTKRRVEAKYLGGELEGVMCIETTSTKQEWNSRLKSLAQTNIFHTEN